MGFAQENKYNDMQKLCLRREIDAEMAQMLRPGLVRPHQATRGLSKMIEVHINRVPSYFDTMWGKKTISWTWGEELKVEKSVEDMGPTRVHN